MKEIRVSHRYASSILNLAIERNELENIRQDMELIKETMNENRELALALQSPIIKPDTKANILKGIFAGKVGEMVMTFLDILVKKGREYLLFDICKAFTLQYKELKNITTVAVTTAVPADEEMRKAITDFIQQAKSNLSITGEIEIKEVVNPELIGGFIIQAGDLQLDHSVKRKFDDLRIEFSKNPYIAEL